jgi:hypothetical protein
MYIASMYIAPQSIELVPFRQSLARLKVESARIERMRAIDL